jgi:type IV pilus assembly protein PilM
MSVGIDIGSKTIKIVELSRDGDRYHLRASGVVSYKGVSPEQTHDDKELVPLVESIKKLYKEAKIGSREVVISLPEQNVFTRVIKFPLLTDAEIASAVKWESEQYIPIPMNEAVVQHQIIERREDKSPGYISVLLVATPKSVVERYARLMELSGLNLVVVESEMLALVRSLAPEDQSSVIVNFGARSTNIGISKNGLLNFSRSIPVAGEALTRAVAQKLGLDEQQAEEYKRTYGLSPSQLEGKVRNALDPVFRMVSEEVKKAIHFYQSESEDPSPKSVILCGGTSGMPEITSSFTKFLGLEVVVGNPFAKVEVSPEAVSSLAGYAQLYSTAVGLALREI